ncbi:MAG: hypothetical protein PHR16_17575 [Methylovulum sp.]|jgi:hypothetical protein|nr:hypothetical protein [Methylovulum sp.]
MPWGTIRRATEEDDRNLRAAAEKFIERHGIECWVIGDDPADGLTAFLEMSGGSYEQECLQRRLRPLWKRIIRRVLGSQNADGIAYGYVGYHQD